MHQIMLNIKSFFKYEKLIFLIMVICVISSAFIINFSYGLYYNYNTQKTESDLELKDINPEIMEGTIITKKDFKQYIESLNDDSLNAMIVIYVASYLDEFSQDDNYGLLNMRFVIHNRQYGICEVTKESYEKNGLLTSGRYISNDEENNGSNVAIVWGLTENDWNMAV